MAKQSSSLSAASIKRSLRIRALDARQIAFKNTASAPQRLLSLGLQFVSDPKGLKVAGYFPIRDELDIVPLLMALHDNDAIIALPVTKPGPTLLFRRWLPTETLMPARFGLFEPLDNNDEVVPQLVFVPLLAFDRRGNRLGFGAGYYDAGLRALRKRQEITAVGVAFDEQEMDTIPHEAHDERLDYVITPSKLIVCGD